MKLSSRISSWTRRLALGAALCAIAAPAAHAEGLAQHSSDGPRAGGPSVGQLTPYAIDAPHGTLAAAELGRVSTDGPRSGPATTLPAFSVDAPRSGPATVDVPGAAPVVLPSFDWADFGIGIAAGVAAGGLLAALALLSRARRRTLSA